jgi:VIT1/CCC1 family predicted Fe2+/Mn2+ transporter
VVAADAGLMQIQLREGAVSRCAEVVRQSTPDDFLAAKSDAEHYEQELARERKEVETIPEAEASEVSAIFRSYGLSKEESHSVVDALRQKPQAWFNFMMRFELGLEEPVRGRALRSALTIAGAYAVGGFVPLFPYILPIQMRSAFLLSVTLTLLALFIFGYIKGRFTGSAPLRGAVQTLIIGALAAAAAWPESTCRPGTQWVPTRGRVPVDTVVSAGIDFMPRTKQYLPRALRQLQSCGACR